MSYGATLNQLLKTKKFKAEDWILFRKSINLSQNERERW